MYSKVTQIIIIFSACVLQDWVVASRLNHDQICPRMCTCDMVKGLKRADCSHENLINTNTDVPTSVEILDLSINMISSIENEDFAEYRYMVKLFLSENSIETIALNAFANLRNLEMLDLSHNRLEQLSENLFEFNEKLIDLNLSNNKFMNLLDRPILNSPSIAHLYLANCKIPQIYDSLFTKLPSLRALDLSSNLLITLSKEPFNSLRRLRVIHLQENKWHCDNTPVRATVNWMKKRLDAIQIESCFLNPYKTKPKLEKIVLDDSKTTREDIAIEKVWGPTTVADYFSSLKEKSCSYSDNQDRENQQTCENFIECQKRYSELYHAYLKGSRVDKRPHYQGDSATILLVGIFIGCIFGSFLTYSIMFLISTCRKGKNGSAKLYSKRIADRQHQLNERSGYPGQRHNDSSINQCTRSNISRQDQCQIYQNHENTRQFLVKLFSKRQPRFVRNNSQIANLSNRYMPPIPVRREYLPPPPASPAPTSSSFTWEPVQQNQHNEELEQLLDRPNLERGLSTESAWNDNFRSEEQRQAPHTPSIHYEAVPPIYVMATDLNTSQTPPPPYVHCTSRSSQNE